MGQSEQQLGSGSESDEQRAASNEAGSLLPVQSPLYLYAAAGRERGR